MRKHCFARAVAVVLASMLLASCASGERSVISDDSLPEDETTAAVSAVSTISDAADNTVEIPEPEQADAPAAEEEENNLSDPQRNSLAMLNYLASLTQEINAAPNSRIFLEEVYSEILNNTDPKAIDSETQDYLSKLLDTINSYRMIAVKRERIQYDYEQQKAQILVNSLPNVDFFFSVIPPTDPDKIGEIAGVVIGVSNAALANFGIVADNLLETSYMHEGWDLDDAEADTLHESRKEAFMYMIDIVRDNDLPSSLALTESDISQFVSWKYNGNTNQKLQFLESSESTYAGFGEYWLELAKCYNETGNYQQCLDCMDRYVDVQAGIFRKDHDLAEAIPAAVASAAILYESSPATYEAIASDWLQLLVDNTDQTDWDLRYFAAQAYADLYAKTMDDHYLTTAYSIVVDNVNQLVSGQRSLNTAYLSDVKELAVSDSLSKEEQKKITDYNKSLNNSRKTELPPVYKPLTLNCDLLFAIAEKLNLSSEEKNRIDGILRSGSDRLFLDETIDNRYRFDSKAVSVSAGLTKSELTLPVSILSEGAVINAKVIDNNTTYTYNDWTVKSVDRAGSSVSGYSAVLTSEKFKKQTWSPNSKISVTVTKPDIADCPPVTVSFAVSSYKNLLVSSLVEFEQVG